MNDWAERKEVWEKKDGDDRDPFEVDYARVIHSASFRRLQGKTQILNLGDSDFYRTRLTHSLEVSQVASGILQKFRKDYKEDYKEEYLPSTTLLQTICLVHDLGHPPFGHGGEVALNFCMRKQKDFVKEDEGFEGNGQTLRILSKLEKFSEEAGSNLTRRTLLGILKYPTPFSKVKTKAPDLKNTPSGEKLLDCSASIPPKCFLDSEQDIVDWILEKLSKTDQETFTLVGLIDEKPKALYKSLDCSIMELADDISYGVHDLEDAIALDLASKELFLDAFKNNYPNHFMEDLSKRYPDEFSNNTFTLFVEKLFSEGKNRKQQISRLVHYFITNTELADRKNLFQEPLLSINAVIKSDAYSFLESLKEFVKKFVILSPNVQHLEFKGQQMVIKVFDTLAHDPQSFLPPDHYKKYNNKGNKDIRVICDYIAGMTDHHLLRTYERLYSPRMGSVFDKL